MIAASASRSSGRFTESRWTAALLKVVEISGAMSRMRNMAPERTLTPLHDAHQGRWRATEPRASATSAPTSSGRPLAVTARCGTITL